MVPERQCDVLEHCHKMTQAKTQVFKMQNLRSISVHEGFHALTKVLTMGSLISVDEEEGVTRVDEAGVKRAVWDTDALTVSSYQESVNKTCTTSAWQPWKTLAAWVSKSAFWTCKGKTSLMKKKICTVLFEDLLGMRLQSFHC